jgi:hypothetical protein
MIPIREGSITLNFPDVSNAVKYDDTPFYQKQIKKLPETKAVDVVFKCNDHSIVLLELKDFRQHRIENKGRLKNTDLAIEVAQKIRDTISGIWGARRRKDPIGIQWDQLYMNPNIRLSGILLLEEDQNRPELQKRVKLIRKELKTKIENYSSFLNIRVNIMTRAEFENRYCVDR